MKGATYRMPCVGYILPDGWRGRVISHCCEVNKKLTSWLQPLLCVEVALQHSLIKEHVPHWLRDDDIDLLWELNLVTGKEENRVGAV